MNVQIKEALIRLPEVQARIGLSRSQIYALIRTKRFPPPLVLLGRTRAWPESSVQAWIAERIAAGRNAAEQPSQASKSITDRRKVHKASQPVSGKHRAS